MRGWLLASLPIALLVGCAATIRRPPTCFSEDLADPFALADTTYLDRRHSIVTPDRVLTAPGALRGHWLARERESDLVIEESPNDSPVDGFREDHFRLRIRDGDQWTFYQYLEAAYGAFTVFGLDLDGDGRDEIIVEYGEGRGTSAYSRKLAIGKAGATHLNRLFETTLSDYLPGRSVSPEMWYRRYRFVDRNENGVVKIELCSVPPGPPQPYLGLTDWTSVFQFPRMTYSFNNRLHTYELDSFEFHHLE
jgi:hypothetical protein